MGNVTTEPAAVQLTITDRLRRVFQGPLQQIARGLIRLGLSANAITFVGFLLNIIPTIFIARGQFFVAGLIFLICAPLDALDGAVARESGKVTRFGALLDSSLDRYSEALLLGGLAYYMAHRGDEIGVILSFVALAGSVMVSYTRARSEGLGIDNKVGMLTRVERTAITILGLLTGYVTVLLWILAIITQITVIQRMWHAYASTAQDGK